jgi:hypothetical protein
LNALLLLPSLLLADAAMAVAAAGVAVAGAGVALAGTGVAVAEGTGVAVAAGTGVAGASTTSSSRSGNRGAWKPPPAVHTAPDEKPLLFWEAQDRLEPEGPLKHLKPPELEV